MQFDDRLGDLNKSSSNNPFNKGSNNPFDGNDDGDVEDPQSRARVTATTPSRLSNKPTHDPSTTKFFQDVGSINKSLTDIRQHMESMKDIQGNLLNSISEQSKQELQSDLDHLMSTTGVLIKQNKNRLQQMDSEIKKLDQNKDPNKFRMRSSMHGTLTRKMLDLMKEYNEAQVEFKSEVRGKAERQIKTVNPNASPEDIDQYIDSGEGGVFAQAIKQTDGSQVVAAAYESAREKHMDIRRIEAQLVELNQLFKDVQTLVDAQGEMIDSIENNVNNAHEYTKKANKQLVIANKHQRRARKKMCCIMAMVGIIGLCIVLATQV